MDQQVAVRIAPHCKQAGLTDSSKYLLNVYRYLRDCLDDFSLLRQLILVHAAVFHDE
jgi:hypothetical protein